MARLPPLYFVQVAQLGGRARPGADPDVVWVTHYVFLDREEALECARQFEAAQELFTDEQGVAVEGRTVARVVTMRELREEGGAAAVERARAAVQDQIAELLAGFRQSL